MGNFADSLRKINDTNIKLRADREKHFKYQESKNLRDQIAIEAMKEFLKDDNGHPSLDSVAEYSYKMADAMLKEREREQ